MYRRGYGIADGIPAFMTQAEAHDKSMAKFATKKVIRNALSRS